jgi:hypothetical protein
VAVVPALVLEEPICIGGDPNLTLVFPGSESGRASAYVEAGVRLGAGVRALSSCARELISSLR